MTFSLRWRIELITDSFDLIWMAEHTDDAATCHVCCSCGWANKAFIDTAVVVVPAGVTCTLRTLCDRTWIVSVGRRDIFC